MTRVRLALAVALASTLAGCEDEAVPPPPIQPVLATTPRKVSMDVFGPFASTIEARYMTRQGFQIAGRMVARDVYVGDSVHKGQRLAALDPTVTQFALLRAKADVANAKAQLANAQGIQTRQGLLRAGGDASQATLDNAVAGQATAKARLDQAEASLRMAEDQISYTELKANFDGIVTAWSAEVGQYVDNGQAVVTLARPDVREAVVDIPEELVSRIAPGMEFKVSLQVSPSVVTTAVVREIGPLADEATRTHRVRITLQDASGAFRLGSTVDVSRDIPVKPYLTIPSTAVVEGKDGGSAWVWILARDGKSVSRRTITIAAGSGAADAVRVASGMSEDDRVVEVGVHSLSEGQAVAGVVGPNSYATKEDARP